MYTLKNQCYFESNCIAVHYIRPLQKIINKYLLKHNMLHSVKSKLTISRPETQYQRFSTLLFIASTCDWALIHVRIIFRCHILIQWINTLTTLGHLGLGVKLSTGAMMPYCKLHSPKQISVKIETKFINFDARHWIWNCLLCNTGLFGLASMCIRLLAVFAGNTSIVIDWPKALHFPFSCTFIPDLKVPQDPLWVNLNLVYKNSNLSGKSYIIL